MQVPYDIYNQHDAHCMAYANFLWEEAMHSGHAPQPDTWQEKYENEVEVCRSWVRHYSDRMDDADQMLNSLYAIWCLDEYDYPDALSVAKDLARKAILKWEISIGVRAPE